MDRDISMPVVHPSMSLGVENVRNNIKKRREKQLRMEKGMTEHSSILKIF